METEEPIPEGSGHQQYIATRSIGILCRDDFGDDTDIARIEANLGSRLLAELEDGLLDVTRGLALHLAKLDERRQIGRLEDLLDSDLLQMWACYSCAASEALQAATTISSSSSQICRSIAE